MKLPARGSKQLRAIFARYAKRPQSHFGQDTRKAYNHFKINPKLDRDIDTRTGAARLSNLFIARRAASQLQRNKKVMPKASKFEVFNLHTKAIINRLNRKHDAIKNPRMKDRMAKQINQVRGSAAYLGSRRMRDIWNQSGEIR